MGKESITVDAFKKLLRNATGYGIALPLGLAVKATAVFTGRERAVKLWGPAAAVVVKKLAQWTLIPKAKGPDDFDRFTQQMRRNISRLGLLYDIEVIRHDSNVLALQYANCPHAQAFIRMGLPEMGLHCCHSDWLIAEENKNNWDFSRDCQIGGGDELCNHTYICKTGQSAVLNKDNNHAAQ